MLEVNTVNKQKQKSKFSSLTVKSKTYIVVIPIVLALITYFILDYVNISTLIGLPFSNINVDMFGIIFNSVIVLVLYVVSFYYIDNKQNEKDANARDTVDTLIKKTYQECLGNLKLLDNKAIIEEFIIPKVGGNKSDLDNKVIHNLQTLPFSSFDSVIDLAVNGYVEKDKLDNYLDIKKEYQYLVSVKITFFDLVNPKTDDQKALYYDILARDNVIKRKLNGFLNKTY